MSLCQSCGERDAVFHITLQVSIFGPKSTRLKSVQFILCDRCEVGLQQVFCKDDLQKARLAVRLSDAPEFMSESPSAWKKRERGYNPVKQV